MRFVEAIDAVEESGFAGAIRSDDGQDLFIPDLRAHVREGIDAAKAEGEVIDLQFHLCICVHLSSVPAHDIP